MPTVTERVLLDDVAYVDLSKGDINVAVIANTGALRFHVADIAPAVDVDAYWMAPQRQGPAVTLTDMNTATRLWVRAEKGQADVTVVRGDGKLNIASQWPEGV